MPKKERLFFEVSARLQKVLGQDLIADDYVAIGELVKNAYDANASEVTIECQLESDNPAEHQIIISDNGNGMDFGEFKENWMAPGFSSKDKALPEGEKRVPLGEKGIGRFAAGKLANRLHVYTKKKGEDGWLHVYFDWSRFENMRQPMREVTIPYDERDPAAFPYDHGTQVVLDGLRTNWLGKVPGRKVAGRPDIKLERLLADLSLLLMPFREHSGFEIRFICDRPRLNMIIKKDFLDVAEYAYVFSTKKNEGDGIFIERSLRRSAEISNLTGKVKNEEIKKEEKPGDLLCGPFAGIFYYVPLDASRASRMNVSPGIKLYRDGFKVEPYGNSENDWLDVKGWKARRAGYAPIRPARFFGYIEISRKNNPDLIDTSNREGLAGNAAYDEFVALAGEEFQKFATIVGDEYVKDIRWEESQLKTVKQEATGKLEFLIKMMQVLGHAIRQPLQGIKSERSVIETKIEDSQVSIRAREEIKDSLDRIDEFIVKANDTIERLLSLEGPGHTEMERFKISEIVDAELVAWENEAKKEGITIVKDGDHEDVLVSNKLLLREGLSVLMRNAFEAFEGVGHEGKLIVIKWSKIGIKKFKISVRDNGKGISVNVQGRLFKENISTKGRYGWGLYLLYRQLPLVGGKPQLVASAEGEGSEFAIEFESGSLLSG